MDYIGIMERKIQTTIVYSIIGFVVGLILGTSWVTVWFKGL